jgi:signal recognition particle GTPase
MGYMDFQVADDLSARLIDELSTWGRNILDLEVIKADENHAAVAYAAVESQEAEGLKLSGRP